MIKRHSTYLLEGTAAIIFKGIPAIKSRTSGRIAYIAATVRSPNVHTSYLPDMVV